MNAALLILFFKGLGGEAPVTPGGAHLLGTAYYTPILSGLVHYEPVLSGTLNVEPVLKGAAGYETG